MESNITHYKNVLQEELENLEAELETVGRKNPENPDDWEATENADADSAEDGEVADDLEEYDNNKGVVAQLEERLAEVKLSLEKIEKGTFGACEVCGMEIESDRLEANPAAKTCKAHM